MIAPAEAPFVSVVIPARNAARSLGLCLAALLAGDYPSASMEVLVVEGASTDGTPALIDTFSRRDTRVRRLANPAGNTPAGLNVGLHAARGTIIVRLDAHAIPAPDYVMACVMALKRTGADVVGGRMIGRGVTAFGRAVAIATQQPFGSGNAAFRIGGAGPVDTVYLGAWPRMVFDRVGYFDEELDRNQDYELCERIRRSGGVVWLDPAIRTTTLTRGTPSTLARQYFGYGMGRAATWRRHPSSLRARQALPAAFVATVAGLALAAPHSMRARRALWAAVGAYGVAAGAATEVAAGGPGGRASASADADGGVSRHDLLLAFTVMHVSWGLGFWSGLGREIRRMAGPR